MIRWVDTSHVLLLVNSRSFVSQYGSVVSVHPCHGFIVVAVETGQLFGLDYNLGIKFVLQPKDSDNQGVDESFGSPQCVCFSHDEFRAAAGYANGFIVLWRIPPELFKGGIPDENQVYAADIIRPISLTERFARNSQGHLRDVPVTSISFIGESHHHFVSTDASGLIFFHHTFKRFFRKHSASQKILGKNDSNNADPNGSYLIHGSELLPVGTCPQITDNLGLLLVITGNILMIISVRSLDNDGYPFPITHFKISRPKSSTPHSRGCLAWYPCIESKSEIRNAKLAYAWGDVLTILELDNRSLPLDLMTRIADLKEKNKGIPKLPIRKTARWARGVPNSTIVSLQWLNSDIVTAVFHSGTTTENEIRFFFYKEGNSELIELGQDRLGDNELARVNQSFKNRAGDTVTLQDFRGSFKIFRHKFMAVVNSHTESTKSIIYGECFKWAERIKSFLDNGDFWSALNIAFEDYASDSEGDLLLYGLPHNVKDRRELVRPFLLDIMKRSILPLMSSDVGDDAAAAERSPLLLYMHILSTLGGKKESQNISNAKDELLDALFDACDDRYRNEFFSLLEDRILSQDITRLPPSVFKGLVVTYVDQGKGNRLTELICLLDISTLNIDLTLQLCSQFKLRECEVYIWNKLMHDYVSPLVLLMDDAFTGIENNDLVFTYISFILSGRQYPSDQYFDESEAKVARDSLCNVIFSMGLVHWPPGSDKFLFEDRKDDVFPYLTALLKIDTFETLSSLNEFFENPCLNHEDSYLTRQYIVEALLDVFEANKEAFSQDDLVHLAIFNGRNYPKYFQFIRLSETLLRQTIELLCQNRNDELVSDCELALESILSVYEVESDAHLLEQMRAAKFFNVLFNIHKSAGQYTKALNMWLAKQQHDNVVSPERNFAVLASILEITYKSKDASLAEQAHLADFIKVHFTELVALSPRDMVLLASTYRPELHLIALSCEDKQLAYEYLDAFFKANGDKPLNDISARLCCRYMELMDKEELNANLAKFLPSLKRFEKEWQHIKLFFAENGNSRAQMAILMEEGSFTEAITVSKKAMALVLEDYKDQTSEAIDKLAEITQTATSVCVKANSEEAWLQLMQELVRLSEKTSDENLRKVINENIYKGFRQMDEHIDGILGQVLTKARLSNIGAVLQDVMRWYLIEKEMHTVTVGRIDKGSMKFMAMIKEEKLLGWLVKNRYCTFCGKSLFGESAIPGSALIGEQNGLGQLAGPGLFLSVRQRMAWEARQRNNTEGEKLGKVNMEDFRDCQIIVFKCQHGYHGNCYADKAHRKCMVCFPE